MPIPDQFIQIDEEGYPLSQEIRIHDHDAGHEILSNLNLHASGSFVSTFGETPVIVEVFDEPYVAQQINKSDNAWKLLLPYDLELKFDLKSLSLDEWDRFHGYAENDVPFVMSRKAQVMFFDSLDEFDDDSITSDGVQYDVPPYWHSKSELGKEAFWSGIYSKSENPGWNLGAPAPALNEMMQRVKLTKSRILILGCGEGHDAARFAQDGHVVTAVDISAIALEKAKFLYGHLANIQFVEADIFKLPAHFDKTFDLVFEHTCYCAISPTKRNELIKVWNRVLTDQGQLMGVFFSCERRNGPPFGGSEWELRQRLKKNYQPIFWGRWQNSVPRRQGQEFFVFMRKLTHAL